MQRLILLASLRDMQTVIGKKVFNKSLLYSVVRVPGLLVSCWCGTVGLDSRRASSFLFCSTCFMDAAGCDISSTALKFVVQQTLISWASLRCGREES